MALIRDYGAWLVLGLLIASTVLWILFRPTPTSAFSDYAVAGQPWGLIA